MAALALGGLAGGLLSSLFGGKEEEKEETPLVQPDPEDPQRRIKNRREQAIKSKEGGRESTLLGGNFSKKTLG